MVSEKGISPLQLLLLDLCCFVGFIVYTKIPCDVISEKKSPNIFNSLYLNLSLFLTVHKGGLWCFGGNGLAFTTHASPVPEEIVETFCLQAIEKHTVVGLLVNVCRLLHLVQ